jgi:CBS domain-containing protein
MHSPVCACSPTTTLSIAAREMETNNVGSLVVIDEGEKIIGIITDRDLALCMARGHGTDTPVERVMSRNVVTVADDADIDEAAAAMDTRGVRRLPVIDGAGRAIGMISLDDLYYRLTQETITLAGAARAQRVVRA